MPSRYRPREFRGANARHCKVSPSMSIAGHKPAIAKFRQVSVAAVLALSFFLAACGSSSPARESGEQTTTSSDPQVAESKAAVLRYLKGTNTEPSGGMVKAQKGAKVVILSCGQALPTCSIPAEGALAASEALGWDGRIYDGKLTISNYGPLIDQAVAAGVDGIMVVGVPCALAQASFARAKAAGVKIANVLGVDCNDAYDGKPTGQDSLYTVVQFAEYPSSRTFLNGWARAKADNLIAEKNGEARVLNFDMTAVESNHAIAVAQQDQLQKCKKCEVYTAQYGPADFGPKLQATAQQAAIKYPAVNAALTESDGTLLGGVQAGLGSAGRPITIGGSEGSTPAAFKLLKSGQIDSVLAYSSTWAGWAVADTLNSLLVGGPVRNSGIGWQLVTRETDPTDKGGNYVPPVDFESAYKRLWGGL